MQGAITHLYAGVPVSELGASIEWYTRFFDSNGVRHVTIPDPDGNAIAYAEPPDGVDGGG